MSRPRPSPTRETPRALLSDPGALGAFGMAASPALLADAAVQGALQSVRASALLNCLFLLGWASSVRGLLVAGGVGASRTGRMLALLQLAALAVAFAWGPLAAFGADVPSLQPALRVTDAAWPGCVAQMLALGAWVACHASWTGWRRFAPLACGLALPAGVLLDFTAGPAVAQRLAAPYFAAAWALLGHAVRTAKEAPHPALPPHSQRDLPCSSIDLPN